MASRPLPDGWVVDSAGAIYDVRIGRTTTRLMNVEDMLNQLLFVDRQSLVFYYARLQNGEGGVFNGIDAVAPALSSQRMLHPTAALGTGADALSLMRMAYVSIMPERRLGSDLPSYTTRRPPEAKPEMFVVSTFDDPRLSVGSDLHPNVGSVDTRCPSLKSNLSVAPSGVVYRNGIRVSGAVGAKKERDARSYFHTFAQSPTLGDMVTLFSVGEYGLVLEAVSVSAGAYNSRGSSNVPHRAYREWVRGRHGHST